MSNPIFRPDSDDLSLGLDMSVLQSAIVLGLSEEQVHAFFKTVQPSGNRKNRSRDIKSKFKAQVNVRGTGYGFTDFVKETLATTDSPVQD